MILQFAGRLSFQQTKLATLQTEQQVMERMNTSEQDADKEADNAAHDSLRQTPWQYPFAVSVRMPGPRPVCGSIQQHIFGLQNNRVTAVLCIF